MLRVVVVCFLFWFFFKLVWLVTFKKYFYIYMKINTKPPSFLSRLFQCDWKSLV